MRRRKRNRAVSGGSTYRRSRAVYRADAGLEMLREAVKTTGRGLHITLRKTFTTFPTVTTGTAKTSGTTGAIRSHRQQNAGSSWAYLSKDDIALLNQRDAFLVHKPVQT